MQQHRLRHVFIHAGRSRAEFRFWLFLGNAGETNLQSGGRNHVGIFTRELCCLHPCVSSNQITTSLLPRVLLDIWRNGLLVRSRPFAAVVVSAPHAQFHVPDRAIGRAERSLSHGPMLEIRGRIQAAAGGSDPREAQVAFTRKACGLETVFTH